MDHFNEAVTRSRIARNSRKTNVAVLMGGAGLVAASMVFALNGRPIYWALAVFFAAGWIAKFLEVIRGKERGATPDLETAFRNAKSLSENWDYDESVAAALLSVMRGSEGIGDIDKTTELDCLVTIPMEEYERSRAAVLESVAAGKWGVLVNDYRTSVSSTANCVQVNLLEREDGAGMVVEFYSYFELFAKDNCRVLRTLTPAELDAARAFATVRIPLRAPQRRTAEEQ